MPRKPRRRQPVVLRLDRGGRVICEVTLHKGSTKIVVPTAANPTPAEREELVFWLRSQVCPDQSQDDLYKALFHR